VGEPTSGQLAFERHEVVTGLAKRQTVLAASLLGDAIAELAVVSTDEDQGRRLHLYALDNKTWTQRLNATLRSEVLFVDVANIDGHDRLISYEHGRISWFDPILATEKVLVEVATNYRATNGDEIPQIDIATDVNRDGRDDILLPDIDGFWISIQLSDGSFTKAVKLGPPEPFRDMPGLDDSGISTSRKYGEVGITSLTFPWYQSRVHQIDYNQDGRTDLVFWNEDHFDIYYQNESGLFDPIAEAPTIDVAFDSEGVYSRVFDYSDAGPLSLLFGFREKTRRKMLHSLRDLNGDRIADLVTLTLSGRSMLKQRSLYEVYFGTGTPNGILFASKAATSIQPKGKGGGLQGWGYASHRFEDFDGDGQLDAMFGEVNIGIGGMARALVANSVSMDLEFYRMENGLYPNKPTTTHRIRPDLRPLKGRGAIFFPGALMGDVNGDGLSDLIVGNSREELHVFLGVPGPNLLSRNPHRVKVALPGDQDQNIWLAHLDKDGKEDILIHHPSATEPHRVIMLLAR